MRVLMLAMLVCVAAPVCLCGQGKGKEIPAELVGVAGMLEEIALDPDEVAPVSSVMLQRDVGAFALEQGTIYLGKPMGGRIRAALFVGQGTFIYTPPTFVEREQLARFYETQALQEEFTSAVLLFDDSTVEELSRALSFAAGEIPASAEKLFKDGRRVLLGDVGYTFGYEMTQTLLENARNDLFVAYMARGRRDPICFAINPFEVEEVMLLRSYGDGMRLSILEVVNQFHHQHEYMAGVDPAERKDILDITAYTIDCSIDDGMRFRVRADVRFRQRGPRTRWLTFDLFPTMIMDSMRWGNGSRAEFLKAKESGFIWVKNDSVAPAGSDLVLTMHYQGKMIERYENWFFLLSSIGWYPTHGYKQKSTFDMTFHTPEQYTFVGVGDNVSSETVNEVTTSRWVVDKPIRNASFNIGTLLKYEVKESNTAPITVMMSRTGREEQVGQDVATSMEFFNKIFGPLSFTKFNATEIPDAHGEAFPGLIHLSQSTFYTDDDETGFEEYFRAHEVAHQWWGIGVDFASYHDQWLSEGFASYSGLLYLAMARRDNNRFFYWIRNYRDRIMKNRKSIFGSGQEAGPIWLGYRTQSVRTAADYDLIIYCKGAWVLHMLRNLVMDPARLNDDKFLAIMKDFFATYNGKEATTEDFQRTIEKHVGVDMQWFFDQWVYGTAVPTYKFAYDVKDTLDGKYIATCAVRQLNVPEDFKMYVPVRVVFADGEMARVRVLVQGPYTEVRLPLLPKKPEEIMLNDLESVLCEVENIDWEERAK